MAGGLLPIEIITGTDFVKTLQWKANGQLVNTTGYTGRMQLRPDARSNIVLYELNSTNGGITFDPVAGTIKLLIPKAVTTTFTLATAQYDFHTIDAFGLEQYLFGGPVRIIQGVTR